MEIILIGLGATVVFDLWLALLKRMGVKTMNMAFVGRWAGHLLQGRFTHASIAAAPAVAKTVPPFSTQFFNFCAAPLSMCWPQT